VPSGNGRLWDRVCIKVLVRIALPAFLRVNLGKQDLVYGNYGRVILFQPSRTHTSWYPESIASTTLTLWQAVQVSGITASPYLLHANHATNAYDFVAVKHLNEIVYGRLLSILEVETHGHNADLLYHMINLTIEEFDFIGVPSNASKLNVKNTLSVSPYMYSAFVRTLPDCVSHTLSA
jgi:hypothetical protein